MLGFALSVVVADPSSRELEECFVDSEVEDGNLEFVLIIRMRFTEIDPGGQALVGSIIEDQLPQEEEGTGPERGFAAESGSEFGHCLHLNFTRHMDVGRRLRPSDIVEIEGREVGAHGFR